MSVVLLPEGIGPSQVTINVIHKPQVFSTGVANARDPVRTCAPNLLAPPSEPPPPTPAVGVFFGAQSASAQDDQCVANQRKCCWRQLKTHFNSCRFIAYIPVRLATRWCRPVPWVPTARRPSSAGATRCPFCTRGGNDELPPPDLHPGQRRLSAREGPPGAP